MAALEALVGGLTPADEDIEFLQQTGIIPSVEDSGTTTTIPYTAGAGPTNPNTGTTDTGVLQAIQKLDEKMAGGFAQIMAKLSNTPMNGGQIKSQQNIEMSTTTQPVAQPSFFSQITNGIKSVGKTVGNSVKSLVPPPKNTGAAGAVAPTPSTAAPAAGGGRRRTRKSRRGRKPSRRGRRRN